MADFTVAVQGRKCRSSGTKVSEKIPQIFRPKLHPEYVTAFSGRTDAPDARCDLTNSQTDRQTDRHTHTHRQDNYNNPRACAPRVNYQYALLHALKFGFYILSAAPTWPYSIRPAFKFSHIAPAGYLD